MDDELMKFFDLSKDFPREEIRVGGITGDPRVLAIETTDCKNIKREEIGTDYVDEIVAKEKQRMETMGERKVKQQNNNSLDDFEMYDDDNSIPEEDIEIRKDHEYYEKFHFDLNRDETLPIYAYRDQIMNAINTNRVVIIEGDTGCGKTTQVPQYILDDAFKRREYCNIVVTQPRRIAAISIAGRVSDERKWSRGTVCSYQVGLHTERSHDDTRLLYCTTGVLLNSIIRNKTLTHFTHVIIDEIHERDLEMDFLLIVVRRLLTINSQNVKIILMSATIDTSIFVDYFSVKNYRPPVISTNHSRKYPLRKFYRDQLSTFYMQRRVDPQSMEPTITDSSYSTAVKLLMIIDNMERSDSNTPYEEAVRTGSVLIFLPGLHEIDVMAENITSVIKHKPNMLVSLVRCHSLLSPDTQAAVFEAAPPGHRKVILATNIAESSITVPDVSYVIDFCLTKVLVTDTATNFSTLKLMWASKANCHQRAGRAGRVRSGRVYRLVDRAFFDQCLPDFGEPEMRRAPLFKPVLMAKLLDLGKPYEILALALSPPNLSDVTNTVMLLKEVGALYTTVDGVYDPMDGDLTYWGKVMSALPLDVRLSRLVIMGHLFNMPEETIAIAAGLTVRAIYSRYDGIRSFKNSWGPTIWADGSGSDLIALWRIYETYVNVAFNLHTNMKQWANRFDFNLRSLNEMHLLVENLRQRCRQHRLSALPTHLCEKWNAHEKPMILSVIIAGAFYPNYFLRNNLEDGERAIYHTLVGHDPCTTVYLTNCQLNGMGELYSSQVKDLFREANIRPEQIEVYFPPCSQKVVVKFKRDENSDNSNVQSIVPGRAMAEVHKAIRLRGCRMMHTFNIMDHNSAVKYVKQHKIGSIVDGRWLPPSPRIDISDYILPSVFDKVVRGKVIYIQNCGQFYFQPHYVAEQIDQMTKMFNSPKQLEMKVPNASAVTKGEQLLALRHGKFQRVHLISVKIKGYSSPMFVVRFIDFGDTAVVPLDKLRLMLPELQKLFETLPPRMYECRLALVRSALFNGSHNLWPEEANEMLINLTKCGRVEVEIYSVVNGIVSVIIHMPDGILNNTFVERNWARRTDEDFMSRQDHDYRIRKQANQQYIKANERQLLNEQHMLSSMPPTCIEVEPPPPAHLCNQSVCLKGPYSPLETSVYSIMRVGLWKTVQIERESVNGFMLNIDPQDKHGQFLVAASVANNNRGELVARGTSMMPNVAGFGALMTMIFCPTMQLKCNSECTKFVSIVAGLGCHPDTMEPYHEEHDLILNLDVVINRQDICTINRIRHCIDSIYFTSVIDEIPPILDNDKAVTFKEIRTLLMELFNKDRAFIEQTMEGGQNDWETEKEDSEKFQPPFGSRTLFKLHSIPKLKDENHLALLDLRKHCKELYDSCNLDSFLQPLCCQLCNQNLENCIELRMHLLCQKHRDRETQVGFKRT